MQRYNRTAGKHPAPVLYTGEYLPFKFSYLPSGPLGPLKFDAADRVKSGNSLFKPL